MILGYSNEETCTHYRYENDLFKEEGDLFVSEHKGFNRDHYVISVPRHHFSGMFPFGTSRQEVYDLLIHVTHMNFFDLRVILRELKHLTD